jgi:cytochrome c oxidase cbb3-type subunit 2
MTDINKKPIIFTLLAAVTILTGTIIMVFVPLVMSSTQPTNTLQKPYTALELAGRDMYQREGCNNCHTQTVRPLRAEIARYGPYSKGWEFAYDRPMLWGSKRTGPDLARVGGKYSDKWHFKHFSYPAKLAFGSNMPAYDFLADRDLNPASVEAHMRGARLDYTAEDIDELDGLTELDALVAYVQKLGIAVPRPPRAKMIEDGEANPLVNNEEALAFGKRLYEMNCTGCHGIDGKGDVGSNLTDVIWLGTQAPIEDWEIFQVISNGTTKGFKRQAEGGMVPFGDFMGKQKIWSIVAYIRSIESEY